MKLRYAMLVFITLALAFTGCAKKADNPEEQVQQNLSQIHTLTADERSRATVNAKAYFEKGWINAGGANGQLNSCRPSDSNKNGMVTCSGFIPNPSTDGKPAGYTEKTRYCGYRPELVGCSDVDTVPQ